MNRHQIETEIDFILRRAMASQLHPDVIEEEQTCYGCPDQWRGTFWDGRKFYFRYRWGDAALKTWTDDIWHATHAGMKHGDYLQGTFESTEERKKVFGELWKVTQMGLQE